MMLTDWFAGPQATGLLWLGAALGFAIRATLLSGRASGWPTAPWPVKLALWLAGGAMAAEALVLLWRGDRAPPELVLLGLALGGYSAVTAVNLVLQRDAKHCAAARAKILQFVPAIGERAGVVRKGEPPRFPPL